MLRTFLAFVKKEWFHILRDRRTLVILFGMPIAQVLIFGYAVTNEFKDASIAIYDQSEDQLSKELVAKLEASGHFRVSSRPDNYAKLERSFKAGEVKMAIVIPAHFEEDFYENRAPELQLITDASEPNYATTLVAYASQMIRGFQQERGGVAQLPYQVEVTSRMVYNPQLKSAYNFIPGVVALILLLISAMMTSLTIAREKELGTMDLLLVSPLPPLLIILGKVTPYVLLSFINAIVILAMGYFIFDVPILGNLILLLSLCLLYLLTALALGVLISTKSPTQQAAMMGSLFMLMMPTMLLSGFIFPISSMPVFLQYLSSIIPATYFIDILKSVMLKGTGWSYIWQPTLVLALMAFILLMAAWRNFKVVSK